MIDSKLPNRFTNAAKLRKDLKTKSETEWVARGRRRALELFHAMSKRVPAYKDFLKKHQVKPATIKTFQDFSRVPSIDKDNYLRKYKLQDLCWDGKFAQKPWVIAATSGSTGEPYYFPRQPLQDSMYEIIAELYLLENFNIDKKRTLYINAFPLGIWIGGLFTYEAIYRVMLKNSYQLSIVNPGINILETINAIKNLGHQYDQIIIGAYGPFLKDIIDEGEKEGLKWKQLDMGFILSAESFSELFRDYIYKKTAIKDPYRASLNHYGTVDLGTMSHETPISIMARRLALQNEQLNELMFPDTIKLPTLTQYIPELFYFEQEKDNLLCSSTSGIPLFRYDLKDIGRVFSTKDLRAWFARCGLDLEAELKKAKIEDSLWNLPFVYVYERNDFSVSYFAFQIYPETIRKALLDTTLQESITGKFVMHVNDDKNGKQIFTINVELKKGLSDTKKITSSIAEVVIEQLLLESSEYRKIYGEYGRTRVEPVVIPWPYQDSTYFKTGTKQKWVQK